VGVPPGTALRRSGDITVTKPGTVINGRDVRGSIEIDATNVTIQNTRVTKVGGGCGPSTTCGNADIRVGCACAVTISHVELTTDATSTVEHAIRNSFGGKILVDHVYQHGGTDALCWCGDATIMDSYSYIHLAIADDHLENLYADDATVDVEHSVLFNANPQTANVFGNVNNGSGGPCANRLTVKNNLLAGGGVTIDACAHAISVGSSTLDFEGNRIARCGKGPPVPGPDGTWLCADAPRSSPYLSTDGKGWYPRGGAYGHVLDDFCGSAGWVWKNNAWTDGREVAC